MKPASLVVDEGGCARALQHNSHRAQQAAGSDLSSIPLREHRFRFELAVNASTQATEVRVLAETL